VITILTPDNIEYIDKILDFFVDHGITGIKLNTLACIGRGKGETGISGEQYARAMIACMRRIARTGNPEPLNADLMVILEAFIFGRDDLLPDHQNCYSYTCSGGKFFFGLEDNGDVYPCGRASDTKGFRLFNILDNELDQKSVRQALLALHHKDAWYVRCFSCSARRICSFGCPAFETGNPVEREIQCSFTREMFRRLSSSPALVEEVRRVLEVSFSKPDQQPPGISVA
jgi:radical SAM protein with 4Fe4S-binding SPASM domain